MTTPILRALKKQYPSTHIDYLVKSRYSDVIKYNPYVEQIFEYEKTQQLSKKLKENNYDLVIDLQNNFRSRAITSKLKATVYRFRKPTLKKLLLVFLKINLYKDFKSIVNRYAESIPGLKLDDKGLDLFLPKDSEKITTELNNKYIGFCPGSRHFTKRWPLEYFIELGNMLRKDDYKVILFGGKDDYDICKEISEQIFGSINYQNEDKILKTAHNMKKCKLIITNDSGMMHTASAVGIPVIVLFGSSVKEFGFAPYRNKNLIIENNHLKCRPCSHIGKEFCPKKHFKCMRDLTPALVYEKFREFEDTL